jgi:hypothetical protein
MPYGKYLEAIHAIDSIDRSNNIRKLDLKKIGRFPYWSSLMFYQHRILEKALMRLYARDCNKQPFSNKLSVECFATNASLSHPLQ